LGEGCLAPAKFGIGTVVFILIRPRPDTGTWKLAETITRKTGAMPIAIRISVFGSVKLSSKLHKRLRKLASGLAKTGSMADRLSMAELAEWIHLHLKAMENDPKINTRAPDRIPGVKGLQRLWHSSAYYAGRGPKIQVTYISFQGSSTLSREEAEIYLAYLESGKTGRHYEALRDR